MNFSILLFMSIALLVVLQSVESVPVADPQDDPLPDSPAIGQPAAAAKNGGSLDFVLKLPISVKVGTAEMPQISQ